MAGQNRTDFEVKQRIDALPPIVRAQLTEILLEMLNGSTQRALSASSITATTAVIGGNTLSGTELGYLDGVVAGTAQASKAVVLGTNKEIDTLVIPNGGLSLGAGAGTAVTSTAAELNLLDGSSSANSTVSVAAILDSSGYLQTGGGLGGVHAVTPNTLGGVTAVTYGDGWNNTTVLTISDAAMVSGDTAALASGIKLLDFPAGRIAIREVYMNVYIASLDATIQADTPELGIGTDLAVGAYSTLGDVDAGETLTTENIINGAPPLADCNGTGKIASAVVNTIHVIPSLYLNIADTWGNGESTALSATGTVVISWQYLA